MHHRHVYSAEDKFAERYNVSPYWVKDVCNHTYDEMDYYVHLFVTDFTEISEDLRFANTRLGKSMLGGRDTTIDVDRELVYLFSKKLMYPRSITSLIYVKICSFIDQYNRIHNDGSLYSFVKNSHVNRETFDYMKISPNNP